MVGVRIKNKQCGTLLPMSSRFISLGSGQILPWDTHPDLSLLHQLKLFNFPISNGLVFLNAEKTVPSDIQELESEVSAREFSLELLIQAFIAGKSTSILSQVSPIGNLKSAVGLLMDEITHQFNLSDIRVDFLVSENIPGSVFGTAISQTGFCHDKIIFTIKSPTDELPSQNLTIEKLAMGERKIRGDFRGRVQDLLRLTRRALGEDDWRISWIDNGSETFLTSIKKWNADKMDSDLFVHIPFFELFESEPSYLEKSLLRSISSKLSQYFHHWSNELSPMRPFVGMEKTQIKFNYSFLSDFLSSFGLSTHPLRLLDLKMDLPSTLFNSVRFWRKLPKLLRFLHDLSLAPGLAIRLTQKISQFETGAEKSFSELFAQWQALYATSSHALYRLVGKIYVSGFIPSKNYQQKSLSAERTLREETLKALAQVHRAIEMKALGWYSRGILLSAEAIWDLTPEEVLAIEEKQFH